ncbi:MAG TPA: alpha/beta fold hydrolase [Acidimicrobiales bacterium]|nr:alpha/beta fold hydrolase [Acidimicrobiales bacterium]
MPYVEVAGVRLHYVDVGAGDVPVVLLHAFPLHSDMWAHQVACLAAKHRVIVPDLKGFGKSSAPDDETAYSMSDYARQVAGLLQELGVERVVLGGLSMGGYAAFAFLAAHVDMVAALVLADTRAGRDTPEVFQRRTDQQEQVRREGTSNLVETLLTGLLAPETLDGRPQLVEQVRRMMASNPPAGFVGGLEAMKGRADSLPHLSVIKVPALVLVGEHDGPSPPNVVKVWQERIPGSRLVVIPGAGHLSNLEAPEVFNAEVSDFLDTL